MERPIAEHRLRDLADELAADTDEALVAAGANRDDRIAANAYELAHRILKTGSDEWVTELTHRDN